ncbi:MAG: hypothetical protein ABI837_02980 [Acidobacteriota bacterium]
MIAAIRVTGILIVVVLTGLALRRYCVQPYRCNAVKGRVEPQIERIVGLPATIDGTVRIRSFSAELGRCLQHDPHDVGLLVDRAECDVLLGRREEAVARYEEALRYNRRPEIYLSLGLIQYQLGQREAAMRAFGRAHAFAPFLVNYDHTLPWSGERVVDVAPPELGAAIEKESKRLRQELASR